jgi:hypothetical protein
VYGESAGCVVTWEAQMDVKYNLFLIWMRLDKLIEAGILGMISEPFCYAILHSSNTLRAKNFCSKI